MNIINKFKSFLIILLSTVILFSLSAFSINGEEKQLITYSVDSGFSIDLPNQFDHYAIWNQAPSNSVGWKNSGFPSFEVMEEEIGKDGIEYLSHREDGTPDSNYLVFIDQYDAPQELTNDNIYYAFCQRNSKYYNFENASTLGYGVVKVNDLTYFKLFFEADESVYEKAYAYLLVTNDNKIHEIVFWNHGDRNETLYVDSLAYNTMPKLVLSDSLLNSIATLEDVSYTTKQGYYKSLFDYENGLGNYSTTEVVESKTQAPINIVPAKKTFEFPTWIILVAFISIFIFKAKITKKGEWQEDALSLKNTQAIKGFCALGIIIHHLAQELTDKAGVLSVFQDYGVLFVGLFFFFSGYGLYTSLKTKENYLKGFLFKRLTTVLVPLYVCILIFLLFALLEGQSFSIPHLIATISGWLLINNHMWYVIEIVILYLAFYIIYSLIKNRKYATITMSIFVIVLIVFSLLLGHGSDLSSRYWFMGEWWYNTTICFILGIVISQNEGKVFSIAKRLYPILLPLFTVITIELGNLTKHVLNTYSYWNEFPGHPGYKEKFICLIVQSPWVIFFVLTVLLIMMKVKFSNKIINYIGKISLELYLIHNLFLSGLRNGPIMNIKSNSLYILLTILLSIGFASLVYRLDRYIINKIQKKPDIEVNEKSTNRIHSIDTLRIIMAFLVVCIHIPFKGTAGNIFITFGKVAVPFFLVVCGYFLYRQNREDMMIRLKKQTIKILVLYVLSNALYGVIYIVNLYKENLTFSLTKKQILDFILYNMSPFSEHLWFLGSLFYALLILILLNKLNLVNKAMFISPILICLYVVLSHLNVASAYVLRNVVLVGLPYTMMGMLIHRYEDKLKRIKAPILWMTFIALIVTSILELNIYPQGIDVPFISIEIMIYVVVILCLKYPNFGANTLAEKMGIDLSLGIYITHIFVMFILQNCIPANQGLMTTFEAITVFVVTSLVVWLYKCVRKGISKLMINRKQI